MKAFQQYKNQQQQRQQQQRQQQQRQQQQRQQQQKQQLPLSALAVAGLIFLGSITPILSTEVLGIHSAGLELQIPSIVFGSLAALGIIMMVGSAIAKDDVEIMVRRAPGVIESKDGNLEGLGKVLTAIGVAGTLACTLAGLGMIKQELLQETLSGRIFMLNGVAPSALNAGEVIGADFGFAIGGFLVAGFLVAFAMAQRRRAAQFTALESLS